jgi:DNA-binding transcriptional LysR family regulator
MSTSSASRRSSRSRSTAASTRPRARCHLTQTALTRRLQNFEEQLGVKLVERTTRSVALTALGASSCRRPPAARRAHRVARRDPRDRARAARRLSRSRACPRSACQFLPRIIEEYAARHPGNRIVILDHASSGVDRRRAAREAEFGINIAGPEHPELVSRRCSRTASR